MKKITIFIISIFIISIAIVYGYKIHFNNDLKTSSNDLVIYNWGDYIDPELIDLFEEEYGYNVIYETFDSNESMYVKIKANASNYDLAFPSDYMVSKMISEDMLLPLDYSKINNFNNISQTLLNQNFDPNNVYSIPYLWGTVGIVYNTKILDEMNADYPLCYSDLKDEQYKDSVLLVDGAREVLTIGFAINGDSLNTTAPAEIEAAVEQLYDMKDNIKAVVGDEIKVMMVENEAPISIGWSGDASYMMELNENLQYVIPCEGGNIWIDNMVIPKTSNNQQGAYDFINFMLEESHARQNADYIGYESTLTAIINENQGDNKYIYPDEEITDQMEYYIYKDEEQIEDYNSAYLKFKINL